MIAALLVLWIVTTAVDILVYRQMRRHVQALERDPVHLDLTISGALSPEETRAAVVLALTEMNSWPGGLR